MLYERAKRYPLIVPDDSTILVKYFPPSSPLYPDIVILISLQGESVISLNCST